ncbi:MAG: DUF2846 domain-containing protein [Promethearchaeota archaeon]
MVPPEGKALVYIIRYLKGKSGSLKTICDGKYLGGTKVRTFLYTFLDPGTHKFITEGGEANITELELNVEAGKTYFLEQKFPHGMFTQHTTIQIVESDARKYLTKCKLSKDTELKV